MNWILRNLSGLVTAYDLSEYKPTANSKEKLFAFNCFVQRGAQLWNVWEITPDWASGSPPKSKQGTVHVYKQEKEKSPRLKIVLYGDLENTLTGTNL